MHCYFTTQIWLCFVKASTTLVTLSLNRYDRHYKCTCRYKLFSIQLSSMWLKKLWKFDFEKHKSKKNLLSKEHKNLILELVLIREEDSKKKIISADHEVIKRKLLQLSLDKSFCIFTILQYVVLEMLCESEETGGAVFNVLLQKLLLWTHKLVCSNQCRMYYHSRTLIKLL